MTKDFWKDLKETTVQLARTVQLAWPVTLGLLAAVDLEVEEIREDTQATKDLRECQPQAVAVAAAKSIPTLYLTSGLSLKPFQFLTTQSSDGIIRRELLKDFVVETRAIIKSSIWISSQSIDDET